MIVLKPEEAIEHTRRKIAGVEFYNQTFSNCRPELDALLAPMNTPPYVNARRNQRREAEINNALQREAARR